MNSSPDGDPHAWEGDRRRDSPCVGICVLDATSGLCQGCLRTLDEIAVWGASSRAQRAEILAAVAGRRGSG